MSFDFRSLQDMRFAMRCALGGCMVNIDGETRDCIVKHSGSVYFSPTFTILDKETGKELGTFRPHHMRLLLGTDMFQIDGLSKSGGTGTLIVPEHGFLTSHEEDFFDDEADANRARWFAF